MKKRKDSRVSLVPLVRPGWLDRLIRRDKPLFAENLPRQPDEQKTAGGEQVAWGE